MVYLTMGLWMMWLYASIRPRYGPGARTAVIAALALCVVGGLLDVAWARLVPLPLGALVVPVAVGVPITIAAAIVGAWFYRE